MRHVLKGLAVVVMSGALLYLGWLKYHDFLTSGMRPPEGTRRLNEMEKAGVPDFELKDLKGELVRLSDYKDKVVIVNFWASWCDPCVAEFPSMVKLVEFFQGKVVMLAVSADYELADIERFLRSFGGGDQPNIKIVWDKDKSVAKKFGTEALPESYILTRGLKVFRKVAGSEDWFTPDAIQLFHDLTK